MMGRSSAAVKKIIRSIDPNLRWSLAHQELKRCISDEKSMVYSAFKLNTLVQKLNANVQMYLIKYAILHQTVTGKRPEQETDQSHLTNFLTSINNVEISREICRQGIPQGTTLQDLFLKVTEKEAGQQLAEGVALACSTQVMEIQDTDFEINEWGDKPRKDVEVCSFGPVEDLIIYREIVKQVMMMMMINQTVLTEKSVICVILL